MPTVSNSGSCPPVSGERIEEKNGDRSGARGVSGKTGMGQSQAPQLVGQESGELTCRQYEDGERGEPGEEKNSVRAGKALLSYCRRG